MDHRYACLPTLDNYTRARKLTSETQIPPGKMGILYIIAPIYLQHEVHNMYYFETVVGKHVRRVHARSSRTPENASPSCELLKPS